MDNELFQEHLLQYLDDELTPLQRQAMEEHIEANPDLRAEVEATRNLTSDLDTLATVFERQAAVDVSHNVMAEIQRQVAEEDARERYREIRLDSPKRRSFPLSWALGWSLAAVLVLSFIIMQPWKRHITNPPLVAKPPEETIKPPVIPPTNGEGEQEEMVTQTEKGPAIEQPSRKERVPFSDMSPRIVKNLDKDIDTLVEAKLPSLEDVADALVGSMEDAKALLDEWSSLTEDEARALLAQDPGNAAYAYMASESLPREDAIKAMELAAEKNPDEPLVQVRLASLYSLSPEDTSAAMDALAKARELDPNNSLTDYMEAQLLLKEGDNEAALVALQDAAEQETFNAYDLERNQYRATALAGSKGYDESTAALLAGSTPDRSQYNDLDSLARAALDAGDYYYESEQFDLAREFYRSVQDLGVHVFDAATFSEIATVGIEIQRIALDALAELFDYTTETALLWIVNQQLTGLTGGLQGVAAITEGLFGVMQAMIDLELWEDLAELAQTLLTGGEFKAAEEFNN